MVVYNILLFIFIYCKPHNNTLSDIIISSSSVFTIENNNMKCYCHFIQTDQSILKFLIYIILKFNPVLNHSKNPSKRNTAMTFHFEGSGRIGIQNHPFMDY